MRQLLRSSTVRWNLVGVAVVVALVVALWPRSGPSRVAEPASPASTTAPTAAPSGVAVSDAELAAPRAAADLQPCPAPVAGAARSTGPLAELTLPCLGAAGTVDLGAALAGRPAVLDLWTWDCPPCAVELPAMATFARRAGPAVTVLTVHSSPASPYALARLARYGVRLPAVEDPTARVAALVGAPQVFPVTVLLRADGTVAKVLAVPYTDAGAIAADAQRYLGVRA